MENPNTWPLAAKVIAEALKKFNQGGPPIYGKSLIMTIHDDLLTAGHLKDTNETDNNHNSL